MNNTPRPSSPPLRSPEQRRGDPKGSARVAVVVGNPKPSSRTLDAATYVARELAGGAEPDLVVRRSTARPPDRIA